jgi:hypothetical protein
VFLAPKAERREGPVAEKASRAKADQAEENVDESGEARSTTEEVTGRKPVWDVSTHGPVPDDRENVYDVAHPPSAEARADDADAEG